MQLQIMLQQGYGEGRRIRCNGRRYQCRKSDHPLQAFRSRLARARGRASLSEVFGSIATRPHGPLWKKLVAFLGPGYLVAVGYMDPGNWATSLAGGSKFGYALLTVALLSNLMAILLQALCARLGIAPAAISRRPAATPSRARCRGRCGCWPRSRSAPPTSPR